VWEKIDEIILGDDWFRRDRKKTGRNWSKMIFMIIEKEIWDWHNEFNNFPMNDF
jgi:hypothetical protein